MGRFNVTPQDLREAQAEIEAAANALSLIPKGFGGHRHTGAVNPLLAGPPLPWKGQP